MILRLKKYNLKDDPRKVSEVVTDKSGRFAGAVIVKAHANGRSARYFLMTQDLRTGRRRRRCLGKAVYIQGHPSNIIHRNTYRQRVVLQNLKFNNGRLEADVNRESAILINSEKITGTLINSKTMELTVSQEKPYQGWLTEVRPKRFKLRPKRFPYLRFGNLRIRNKRAQKRVA